MANQTQYKSLTLPLSTEMYDVNVFNNNAKIIDEELHKLDEKNQNQDNLMATIQELNTHVNNNENPHEVTKKQIGLGNVDNTSDIDKPVSNEQQNAINEIYIRIENEVSALQIVIDTKTNQIEALEQRITELENKYEELQ